MKINKFEICLIICALLAVSFTAGFFTGKNTRGNVNVSVESVPDDSVIEASDNALMISSAGGDETEPVNINTASKDELTTLPGIGEVLAERIIAYRAEHGSFSSVEELLCVYGIGETIFDRLSDLITVGE